jgi:phosphopantothenate-cysteine ligase
VPGLKDQLTRTLRKHQETRDRLLLLDFCTVSDYLFLLRDISRVLGTELGANAMWYLAAAVSDFHVPPDRMVCCQSMREY